MVDDANMVPADRALAAAMDWYEANARNPAM